MNILDSIVNYICIAIFKFKGWKVQAKPANLPTKLVIIGAPHTSNWDGVYAKATVALLNMKVKFAIKKEAFVFPLGYFFKSLGGMPINRQKYSTNSTNNEPGVVDQLIEAFNNSENLHFLLSPEGTRKLCLKWKTGFYYIAKGANIKIALAYMDYEKKEVGIWSELIDPSELSLDETIDKLKNFYKTKKAKYPNQGIL